MPGSNDVGSEEVSTGSGVGGSGTQGGAGPSGDALLNESSGYILLEDDSYLLLE